MARKASRWAQQARGTKRGKLSRALKLKRGERASGAQLRDVRGGKLGRKNARRARLAGSPRGSGRTR